MTTLDRNQDDEFSPKNAIGKPADGRVKPIPGGVGLRKKLVGRIGGDVLPPELVTGDGDDQQRNIPWTLTAEQKAILYLLIAQDWDIKKIQAILAEEFPDFPALTDRAMRYHRSRIYKQARKEYARVVEESMQNGFACKENRIMVLDGRARRLLGGELTAENNRELRETMKQIGIEAGNYGAVTRPVGGQPAPPANPEVRKRLNTERYAQAREQLELLIHQQSKVRQALDIAGDDAAQ